MEAHVVYILNLLSLIIYHQWLVAEERLQIKNHFITPFSIGHVEMQTMQTADCAD